MMPTIISCVCVCVCVATYAITVLGNSRLAPLMELDKARYSTPFLVSGASN